MPPVSGPTLPSIDPDLASRLGSAQAVDALKRGDVAEALRLSGVSPQEILDFAKSQSAKLQMMVDPPPIYSEMGAIPAPSWNEHFSPESDIGKMTPEDHAVFQEALGHSMGKAMAVGSVKAGVSGKADDAPQSLQDLVHGYTSEASDMIDTLTDKALETQLQMEYTQKSEDLKHELQKLLAMAKDPSTILLALTAYVSHKAGLVASQAGMRVGMYERQNTRYASQIPASTADPKFYAKTEVLKQKMDEGQTNLNQQINLMQSAAQNVESAMVFGHDTIGKLNDNQNIILRNFNVK